MSRAARPNDEARTVELQGGVFCISIDVERAWGVWDVLDDDYLERCARLESLVIERLLALFSDYGVSATWAIVGRLLEPEGGGERTDPAHWCGAEDVRRIAAARPAQDIGSHSFGHIYFDAATAEEADADLGDARRVHASNDSPFVSFVYPRNAVGHQDVLRKHGVGVFRSVDQGFHQKLRDHNRRLGSVANLADKCVPVPAPLVHPRVHVNGLVELPSSMLLLGRLGVRGKIPPSLIALKARKTLDRAARRGGIFHLWFHPSNFYYDTETQFEILETIVRHAGDLRDRGRLEIQPMSHFAGTEA